MRDGYTSSCITWNKDQCVLLTPISLLLSLQEDKNERIQMRLDEIRRVHGLPIKYGEYPEPERNNPDREIENAKDLAPDIDRGERER